MESKDIRHRITGPAPAQADGVVKMERLAEDAGAREVYEDAPLYDWEYRRRRRDVAFYRRLADEQGGPIVDVGCGSGRIMSPLVADGHLVVGLDRSTSMLARAARRLRRLGRGPIQRALLLRGDLSALPLGGRYPFLFSAFHTLQHLTEDADLLAFLRRIRELVTAHGWFAFDVFVPHPDWLGRPPNRRYDHTTFRHPSTGQKTEYSVSHELHGARRTLHMKFHYQPLTEGGVAAGPVRTVRLCHRQLDPGEVESLAAAAGLRVVASWADFAGLPLDRREPHLTEQHVYLLGPAARGGARSGR